MGESKSCGCLNRDSAREQALVNFAASHEANKKPLGVTAAYCVFKVYIDRARKHGLPFAISFEQFYRLTLLDCHYCGASPTNSYGINRGNGRFIYNGLDRTDNDIGYIESNIVPCCRRCNTAKRDYKLSDFLNWIAAVYERAKA